SAGTAFGKDDLFIQSFQKVSDAFRFFAEPVVLLHAIRGFHIQPVLVRASITTNPIPPAMASSIMTPNPLHQGDSLFLDHRSMARIGKGFTMSKKRNTTKATANWIGVSAMKAV